MWTKNGKSYFVTKKVNTMDKVLLSGFAVVVASVILPILLRLIGIEVPLDFLGDGVVTIGEALTFIGSVLLAISQSVRSAARSFLSSKRRND